MDNFEIPVTHHGKEWMLPAKLISFGYTYKLEVEINGTTVSFEPDEEGNWRAVISYEELEKNKTLDKELLSSVANTIEHLLK